VGQHPGINLKKGGFIQDYTVGKHAGMTGMWLPDGWVNIPEYWQDQWLTQWVNIPESLFRGWVNITGMVGQHKTEWWVNMPRNLHCT